jgi:hypothetical protein
MTSPAGCSMNEWCIRRSTDLERGVEQHEVGEHRAAVVAERLEERPAGVDQGVGDPRFVAGLHRQSSSPPGPR